MRLNRPMVLETRVRVPDGAGGAVDGWQALGTLFAAVKPGSGREVQGVEVVTPSVSLRITVRAAPVGSPSRPKAGQRLREGERVFAILAVTEDGDRFLTCHARENA